MTVATFEQPNYLTQSAAAYKAAIDAAIAVLQSIGGDFAPHASTAANMQVVIDAGRIFKPGGTMVSVSQQTTGALIAPVSNPRIDRIVVDSEDGIYSVITGTESASPTAPAIPNGKLPVCQIAMTVAMTTIANSIITDERTTYSPLARLIRMPVEQVISATGGFVREILLSDRGILFDCDCSNGPVTILLPDTASAGNGFVIGVIKSDSTVNEIVLTPSTTGEAFPDGTTKTIGSQNGAGIVTTDGLGQWYLAFDSSRTYNNVTLTGTVSIVPDGSGTGNIGIGSNALNSLTTGNYNIAVGDDSLTSATSANNNNAIGYQSLFSNTTGSSNIAVGAYSMADNTTGAGNVAVGNQALADNINGAYNNAVGYQALLLNTSGSYNVAVGGGALSDNTTGEANVAIGYGALSASVSADSNVGVGGYSLYFTTGGYNTGTGYQSLHYNVGGTYNSALGYRALYNNTSGNYNTGVGYQALNNCSTGAGNIGIGPINSAGTFAPAFNVTTESNRISMGSTSVTNAYIQVAWTAVSDARDKRDIGLVPHGLDFVMGLNPVSYRFKMSRDDETPNGPTRYGFLAQEVLALEGSDPVIIDAEHPEKLRMVDQHLLTVLVKAVQELKKEFDEYKREHP